MTTRFKELVDKRHIGHLAGSRPFVEVEEAPTSEASRASNLDGRPEIGFVIAERDLAASTYRRRCSPPDGVGRIQAEGTKPAILREDSHHWRRNQWTIGHRQISAQICRQTGRRVFPLYHSVMEPPRGRAPLLAVGEGGALPNCRVSAPPRIGQEVANCTEDSVMATHACVCQRARECLPCGTVQPSNGQKCARSRTLFAKKEQPRNASVGGFGDGA